MFQIASTRKLAASRVAASLILHLAGALLLFVVSFPGAPVGLHVRRPVTLLVPSLKGPPPAALKAPPKLVPPRRRFEAPSLRAPEPRPRLVFDLPPTPALDIIPIELARIPAPQSDRFVPPPTLQPVKTGTFEVQPVSPPPARIPATKAAGFASAENAAADRSPKRLTATGGFEIPSATAVTRSVVAARPSGFTPDAAPAAMSSARAATHATVGFGDATVAAASAHRSATSPTASTVSAEILDKPRPSYTDEARRLKIEGEVLLDVMFEASGATKVLRVLHGLGHGLDESAMAAACQIRFRPAQREGVAVDSSAVVHIIFQLAN